MKAEERDTTPSTLVEAALAGDDAGVAAALAEGSAPLSTAAALLLADESALAHLTAATVNTPLPPHDWPPLIYLCNSRYRTDDPAIDAARVSIAKALIGLGADANAGLREAESIRGYRTALGAAVGRARSPKLTELLLASGADSADGPTLYEGCAMWEAVRHRDIDCLRLLLNAEPPQWHVCHALPHALRFNDLAWVRLLLEHDGDPNWTMGIYGFKGNCLHEAVVLDNDADILRALVAHGAHVSFKDRDGRTPLALATCLNRDALAAALREHGAGRGKEEEEVRWVDRWVSACFGGDAVHARRLVSEHSGAPEAVAALYDDKTSVNERERARQRLASCYKPADHLWVCRAIGGLGEPLFASGIARNVALQSLLAGGLSPNAMDDDGEFALHLAAAGNADAVRLLLHQGADLDVMNFRGQTPFEVARAGGAKESQQLLKGAGAQVGGAAFADFAAVFEQAADAVVNGELETLTELLRLHPQLATARSPRPHHCTLLNYLGANGFEGWRQKTPANAVAVVDVLIEAGADANAVCYTYRGGPGENTLGLLTSSGHPREAGLTLAMVAALARGGAKLDDIYVLLAELHEAERQGRFADAVLGIDLVAASTGAAFVEAAMLGESSILFALIDAGVDINVRREGGTTALHQAAINGNAALVDALLERGADPSLRDDVFNGNAAGWAHAGGHEELAGRLAAQIEPPEGKK